MSKKPVRVLCSGDVNGKFSQLINRVLTLQKKFEPFDVLFCVGEFFGPNDEENQKVIDGLIRFPIATYILGPCCPSTSLYYPEKSVEFSFNLTYLGRKGILNTALGLVVGYLSGIECSSNGVPKAFEFSEENVSDLLFPVRANCGFQGLDILLTSIWPADVSRHSSNQPLEEVTNGSKLISKLAAGLKPRYHFAGFGLHYERSPYRNHRVLLESAQLVTRFIGLADIDNNRKEKWLYACSIQPMRYLSKTELTAQPANTTEFPYAHILQEFSEKEQARELMESKTKGAQYFFDNDADPYEEDLVDRGGRRKRRFSGNNESYGGKKQTFIQPDTCWFCLSNAAVVKHLIIAVGSSCYAAMPKGPLNEDHVLVMSIDHVQSIVAASESVRDELIKFRDSLTLMADRQGKVVCFFERNYKTQHLQLHCVSLPKDMGKVLRSSFINAARLKNIEFTFLKDDEQIWDLVNEGSPYFYVELPDGTRMYTKSMTNFSIHFGREVLCGRAILNCEDRIDWRNCELDESKEIEYVTKLKECFKPFDFTGDDEISDDD